MAQDRIHDYRDPAVTTDLNEKIDLILVRCVLEGMQVSPYGTWGVVVGPGSWLCDGVVIRETETVADPIQISPASTQDRIDVIYGQYIYQPTSPTPEASYGVAQGVPSANPQPPELEPYQVKIAEIYVPSTASSISDCTIRNVYTLKEQLEMLLGIKIEGNLWVRPSDPVADDNEKVEDGDFWLDTDTKTPYVWDAASESWVPPSVPPHAPTHQAGGVDPLDVSTLADSQGLLHRETAEGTEWHYYSKEAHERLHISHTSLSDIGPDDHHPRDHASTHLAGGQDALPWGHGGGLDADMVDGHHASEFAPVNHDHPGYALHPHGNEAHQPAFAEEGHTHPLSDIEGVISIGFVGPVQYATDPAPANGGVFWERELPNLDISGTVVEIKELRCHVATAPASNISYTFKVDGTTIGTVTIPSNQSNGTLTLNPPVQISGTPLLQIEAPSNAQGAEGLDAKFVLVRRKA